MSDNLDLFPADKWVKKSEVDHREATEQFKAAVASARSSGDEAIKQVRYRHSFVVGSLFMCFSYVYWLF